MSEEIKDILEELKISIDNPISEEYDCFTEEAFGYPNYFCLDPTTEECKLLYNYITNLQTQLQQKENIIKEVREKIESVRIYGLRSGKTLIAALLNDILEILDKAGDEK